MIQEESPRSNYNYYTLSEDLSIMIVSFLSGETSYQYRFRPCLRESSVGKGILNDPRGITKIQL